MVRPWGLSYTQNITPDQETGIGAYTEAQFIQTLREGKQGCGREILPPMPWPAFKNLMDDTLKAISRVFAHASAVKTKSAGPCHPANEVTGLEVVL